VQIKSFEIFHLQIPFRMSFSHSAARRRSSDGVLVRCVLMDGAVGYGESLPVLTSLAKRSTSSRTISASVFCRF